MQRLIEYFLGGHLQDAVLGLLRSEVYVKVVTLLLCFSGFVAAFYAIAPVPNPQPLNFVFVVCGTLVLVYSASLIAIRFTGAAEVTGHFVTAWTTIITLTVIATSDGPLDSVVTPLIIIPICMGFLLLGLRWGLFWSFLCLFIFVVMSAVALAGYDFPHLMGMGLINGTHALTWTLCLVFLFFVFFSYEWVVFELLHERGGNYSNLYRNYDVQARITDVVEKDLFDSFILQALKRNELYGDKVMIIVISLNLGDEAELESAIRLITTEMVDTVRKIDTVARYSQNKIAVVFENISTEESAELILKFFQEKLTRQYKNTEIPVIELDSIVYPDQAKNAEIVLAKLHRIS